MTAVPSRDRTHHVHVFQAGCSEVIRHLAFRDYLIAHPAAAQRYSNLKRALAARYPNDIDRYMDGKDELVKTLEKQALAWRTARRKPPAAIAGGK